MPIHGNSCTVTTHVHMYVHVYSAIHSVARSMDLSRIYGSQMMYSLVLGDNKGALGDNNKCTLMHGFWIL